MKKLFVLLFVVTLVFGLSEIANATVLTFDSYGTLGVTLAGSMFWNGKGGGHLYMDHWNDNDYIIFSSPTTVNSFQMNAMPWQGYAGNGSEDLVSIAAFDSASSQIWNTTINLSGYTNWNDWLNIPVNTDNITQMTFYATGTLSPYDQGFWPSIDNMVINETFAIPEPASLSLLGLGLVGLLGLRKRRV